MSRLSALVVCLFFYLLLLALALALLCCTSSLTHPCSAHHDQSRDGIVVLHNTRTTSLLAGASHDFSSCVVSNDAVCTARLQAQCSPAKATSIDACNACAAPLAASPCRWPSPIPCRWIPLRSFAARAGQNPAISIATAVRDHVCDMWHEWSPLPPGRIKHGLPTAAASSFLQSGSQLLRSMWQRLAGGYILHVGLRPPPAAWRQRRCGRLRAVINRL